MSIWFYLFLITLIFLLIAIIKIAIMKHEINNIDVSLTKIINTDTNALITLNSSEKSLKRLASSLNKNLSILRKLELEYKNGNQELKQSITNISHDLRTPLTAIRGYLDLMDYKYLTKKQKDYLKYIDNKVNDLTTLTEQLFDFSKSIDNFNKVNKKAVIINKKLEDIICSFYALFKQYNIKPIINITNKKIVRLIDEEMFLRILENILSNAIKYSEGNINIILDDNGIITFKNKTSILDKTSVEKMFNRYYTVENAKRSNGIGLSIAKQLTELNGGNISASIKNNILIISLSFKD